MLLRVFCNMGRHHRYCYVVAGPFWFPMHFLAYVCLEHLFVLVKLYIRNFFSKASNIIDSVKGQEDRFEHFQSLDSFEKSSYVLGSEAWEEYSSGLLGLIKDFVLSVWEERKVRLYREHANVHQSHSQNDSGDLRGVAGGDGELGCLCGKAGTSHLCDGSAHSSGCVVNGSNAMAAV